MLPLQIDAEDAIARGIEFAGVDGILRHGEIGRCVHHVGETLSLVLVDRYVPLQAEIFTSSFWIPPL